MAGASSSGRSKGILEAFLPQPVIQAAAEPRHLGKGRRCSRRCWVTGIPDRDTAWSPAALTPRRARLPSPSMAGCETIISTPEGRHYRTFPRAKSAL